MRVHTPIPFQRTRRTQRGSALIVTLALVLALSMVVAGIQLVTTQQLRETKSQRNYEVALQMAEAGANAYLNEASNSFVDSTSATSVYKFMPPAYTITSGGPTTIAAFRTLYAGGTITSKLRRIGDTTTAAASTSGPGYFVYDTGLAGASIGVYAFGWSNGATRMIHLTAQSSSIFDWAAVYGLNPNTSGNNFAWKFSGSANVIGGVGAEGIFSGGNNATFYDGPVIWANSSYAYNPDPTVLASGNNVPTGHVGSPGLASPLYRHYFRKLNVTTADQDANTWANQTFSQSNTAGSSSPGVEFFRTHNDDNTGLRLLAKNTTTGKVRELPNNPTLISTSGGGAYQLSWPNQGAYTSAGMTNAESPAGIRVYPGNYFFTQVSMSTADLLFLRSFADSETLSASVTTPLTIYNSGGITTATTNPNSDAATCGGTIRFWMGHAASGNDPATTFAGGAGVSSGGTYMEYPKYASRFRVYMASSGGITIKGNNTNPPPPFRVNLLAYNDKDKNQNTVAPYGDVQFQSSVYLYGSLIGWDVTVTGGSTVEKESAEPGAGDKLAFKVLNWAELQ